MDISELNERIPIYQFRDSGGKNDSTFPEHPHTILSGHVKELDKDKPEHATAREALSVAITAAAKLHEGHAVLGQSEETLRRLRPPPTSATPQQIETWNRATRQYAEATAKAFTAADQEYVKVDAKLEATEKALDAAILGKTSPILAQDLAREIRGFLLSMPAQKAKDFVRNAVSNGSLEVYSAVRNAPPYLSGLDADFVQSQGEQAALRYAKDEWTSVQSVRGMRSALANSRAGLQERLQKGSELARKIDLGVAASGPKAFSATPRAAVKA